MLGPFSLARAASLAGIVIMALMIEGTIPVTVDDAWLWSLLALFSVSFLFRSGGRRRGRPWEQKWWWEGGEGEPRESDDD